MDMFRRLGRSLRRRMNEDIYRRSYESHALRDATDEAVGYGSYDLIGKMQLAFLRDQGLQLQDTLLDFGCGNGRLAIHAIPYLSSGKYVGTDVSRTFIGRAQERTRSIVAASGCKVTWSVQTTPAFPLEQGTVDMICAWSVFTHLEHEDTFRYLEAALPLVRPGGKFIFSCLPLALEYAKAVFRDQASMNFARRWSSVRSIATSVDFMSDIARLAGWEVLQWYAGDEANIYVDGQGHPMGQSMCVLARARAAIENKIAT